MMGTRWMTTWRKLPIIRPNATQIPMNSAGCAARMARKSANTSGIRYRKTPRPSFRTGAAFSGLSSAGEGALHHRAQFEDGQVHGDHEATDEHAEDGHDERLEQRGHAVHRVVDFRFVEGGDLAGHGVERAGFFTDRDHLDDHVREQARVFHRALQALTGGDFVAHLQHRILEHDVAASAGHGFQRFHQRHAGGKHGRQGSREARDGSLVEDGSDDGDLERHAVEEHAHHLGALLEVEERVANAAQHQGHGHTVFLQAARHVDDELRERRQVRAETLEQALELRNHEDEQDYRDDDRDDHDGRGIEEGLLHLLLQSLGLFLVGGDLVEQCLERTGLFAGLDQVDVQIVEVQRMFTERLVQRGTAFHVRLDVEDQALHPGLLITVADDLERLLQRYTGT